MFKVYKEWFVHRDLANGTSRMSEMLIAPADLILAFGSPGESDGYKVSGEYLFHDEKNSVVFTMYDWKSTNLYDDDDLSPKEFWSQTTPVQINIGGNHKGDVEEFKRMIKQHIEWVKTGKPFETEVMGLTNPSSGLFLPGVSND